MCSTRTTEAPVPPTSRFIEVDGRANASWHGQFDTVLDVAPQLVVPRSRNPK